MGRSGCGTVQYIYSSILYNIGTLNASWLLGPETKQLSSRSRIFFKKNDRWNHANFCRQYGFVNETC
jgi:hypothetical protein